jgi:FtsH-binding integral membrane protein
VKDSRGFTSNAVYLKVEEEEARERAIQERRRQRKLFYQRIGWRLLYGLGGAAAIGFLAAVSTALYQALGAYALLIPPAIAVVVVLLYGLGIASERVVRIVKDRW